MRRSSRIAKNKSQSCCTDKATNCNQENEIKKRLQIIAILIEEVIYHEGDMEYSAALNYLTVVKRAKEKLPKHSKLLTFCDLLIKQLNKIIEIINTSSKVETKISKNNNKRTENNDHIENEVNSSQETYCPEVESCGIDPADTNELGSDINIVQNNVTSKKIDVENFHPYTIVPQKTELKRNKSVDKPIDLSSHKSTKSANEDTFNERDEISQQPVDYSIKAKIHINKDKSVTTDVSPKTNKSYSDLLNKKNIQTKPEINSCPVLPNRSKPEVVCDQSYSEPIVFRKPLNYKPKVQKNRKQVLEVLVSDETVKTGRKEVLTKLKIDKSKINKLVQMKSNKNMLNNNAIKRAKSVCNIIKKPELQQFTIQFNATPQNSQNTKIILDTEEIYSSEDCFDNIFSDDQTDTDGSLMMLNFKCKQLNINENTESAENTTFISEIQESTDWADGSPIVEIQPATPETNEYSNNEEELQNKIQEIRSQENFKYNKNESVATNIRNYRKSFVRKILQLRDVMQETPIKHKNKQNVDTLFNNKNKDGSSDEIERSQYVCPPSPKTERYKAVETFINSENESHEEFIKRLKDKSRELSGISIQKLLQKMDNYSRL